MLARQITIAPGATAGVFSAVAASPQGDWDVYLSGPTQLVIAEDAGGAYTAFQVGTIAAPLKLSVHNEDVHVKNTAGGSTLALSLVLIQR